MLATNIPNITALRTALDYGDTRLPRCATFYDDARAFRRKFRTILNVPGVDLYDWKSPDCQAGLSEMTITYLEKEGGGLMFWPDDSSSLNYNKYQYSKDSLRIRRLVKQLFFRLNQQQFRNRKYKHKERAETKVIDETGHREQASAPESATISYRDPNTETRLPWPTAVPPAHAETSPAPESSVAQIPLTQRNPAQSATHRDATDRPQGQAPHAFSDSNSRSRIPGSSTAKLAAAGVGGTPRTTAANKPSVNFVFRVVLTRKPKTITERWYPRGRFQDKTLAELLKELPFGDDFLTSEDAASEGLVFTIESECMTAVERMAYDDEGGFASMKRYINPENLDGFWRHMRGAGLTATGPYVDVFIERIASDEGEDEVERTRGGFARGFRA